MGLVIPDEFLQTARMTEADLKLEIAILLFQQQKITLNMASQFANKNQLEFERILGGRRISIGHGVQDGQTDPNALKTNSLEANGVVPTKTPMTQAEILQRMEQRRTFAPSQHHLPDTLTLLQDDRAR